MAGSVSSIAGESAPQRMRWREDWRLSGSDEGQMSIIKIHMTTRLICQIDLPSERVEEIPDHEASLLGYQGAARYKLLRASEVASRQRR